MRISKDIWIRSAVNSRIKMRKDREYESPIHEFRLDKGLSVSELSRLTNIHIGHIAGLANGTMSPIRKDGTMKIMSITLCDFFNVGPETLFPRYICKIPDYIQEQGEFFDTWSEKVAFF